MNSREARIIETIGGALAGGYLGNRYSKSVGVDSVSPTILGGLLGTGSGLGLSKVLRSKALRDLSVATTTAQAARESIRAKSVGGITNAIDSYKKFPGKFNKKEIISKTIIPHIENLRESTILKNPIEQIHSKAKADIGTAIFGIGAKQISRSASQAILPHTQETSKLVGKQFTEYGGRKVVYKGLDNKQLDRLKKDLSHVIGKSDPKMTRVVKEHLINAVLARGLKE